MCVRKEEWDTLGQGPGCLGVKGELWCESPNAITVETWRDKDEMGRVTP